MYRIDDCAIAATSTAIGIIPLRRADKEDMTDFIAKKREMFLVQMSLDTKRDEVLFLLAQHSDPWRSVCVMHACIDPQA